MTALATNVVRTEMVENEYNDPCAASVHVFVGSLVSIDTAGNARPGRATSTDTVRGVAYEEADNSSGSAGAKRVKSRPGVYAFENSEGADEIDGTHVGQTCYVVDDTTVAATSDTGARPQAGRVVRLEAGKVHVAVGFYKGGDGDLVAANNLSDVDNVATARANLGTNKGEIVLSIPSLVAGTHRVPLPDRAVTITKLRSVINGALLTADLTITPSINATPITGGVITVTQSGSAAGDQDEAVPSAANVSDGADDMLVLVLAGNTAAVSGAILVEYTY